MSIYFPKILYTFFILYKIAYFSLIVSKNAKAKGRSFSLLPCLPKLWIIGVPQLFIKENLILRLSLLLPLKAYIKALCCNDMPANNCNHTCFVSPVRGLSIPPVPSIFPVCVGFSRCLQLLTLSKYHFYRHCRWRHLESSYIDFDFHCSICAFSASEISIVVPLLSVAVITFYCSTLCIYP